MSQQFCNKSEEKTLESEEKTLDDQLKDFTQQHPEVVETMELFNISFDKYKSTIGSLHQIKPYIASSTLLPQDNG